MPVPDTLAEAVTAALARHGVQRMFGVPGGGSSLDLIDAAGRHGIDFILARTETAAAIMAAVTGELSGTPGVALAGVGPGAASAVNGIAYAHLERAPMLLFTDGPAASLHQAFDQNALFAPISKSSGRLRPSDGRVGIEWAIDTALTPPRGPVQLDLTAADAAASVAGSPSDAAPALHQPPAREDSSCLSAPDLDAAHELLGNSRKPVVIAGLEARYGDAPEALIKLANALDCPVFLTYKAKGVLPDSHPGFAGLFTGAVGEVQSVGPADLIVLYGLDPVELIPGQWPYAAPILDIFPHAAGGPPAPAACRLVGPLASAVRSVLPVAGHADWTPGEIRALREGLATLLHDNAENRTTQSVVELANQAAPARCRATVDAGAHMFSVLSAWRADEPFGVLKSNGLSTMGYALPAAIASCLEEPLQTVVAFSGDGGLMMCLGELATAVEHGCRIVVVVLNDAALSLIDIKQQKQQRPSRGVRYPRVDFAGIAAVLGCRSWRIDANENLAAALDAAFSHDGPSLIDVTIDPAGYADQLAALRG